MKKNIVIIIGFLILLALATITKYDLSVLLSFILQFGLLFLILIIIVYITEAFLGIYDYRLINRDLRYFEKYKKIREEKDFNLFTWSGEDTSIEYILYYLLNNEKDRIDPVNNLREIKNKVKLRIGNNKEEYILLLKYIEYAEKNNFTTFLKKVSLVIGTYILGKIAFGDLFTNLFGIQTTSNNDTDVKEVIESTEALNSNQEILFSLMEFIVQIFNYGMIGVLFIFLTGFVYTSFSKKKRRIHLLRIIIESILEDDRYFSSK